VSALRAARRVTKDIPFTREEARAYVEGQERWQGVRVRKGEAKKRPWMALELEDIRRYDRSRKPERFVPVGGRYLRG
jgi:hypothetical protein